MVIGGLVLIAVLVVLGIPIWLAVISGATVSWVVGFGNDPLQIIAKLFSQIDITQLLAIPLFLLAGEFLNRGGATKPLINLLLRFMGHLPGGPAYVVILGCAVIAAMSSSSMACVAGFAPIIVPMMTEMGYSKRFSIGLLVCSASLAPTIPPSIPLIIYSYVAQASLPPEMLMGVSISIKDLYAAAFVPGLMLALLLCLTVYFHSRRGHFKRLQPATWTERLQAIKSGWPVMLMPAAVLVPIYTGVVTPTEAAAIAAVFSFALGAFVYRELRLRSILGSLANTARITAMVLIILTGAMLLNFVLSYMDVPQNIGEWIAGAGLGWMAFLLVVMIAFLLMGAFLDSSAILMIVTPILLPSVVLLGIHPVLFGILVTISLEIAAITPPYGVTLFTAVGVLKEEFWFIAKGCFMFYPALVLGQLLIAYIPSIALFLPGLPTRLTG